MKKNNQLVIGIVFFFLLLCLSIVLWIRYNHSARQSEPIKSSINESSTSSQSVEETTEMSSSGELVEEKSKRDNIVDLSNDVLFIYQIKSPQIEKYWKAIGKSFGNLDFVQTIYASKHPSIIVNGSGFSESFDPIGLQIKDGVLYSGWADASITNYAIESFVAMKDGSFQIFDYQTSPEQIISEGGNNSFTFGQSIIRDGVQQVSNGTADWMEYETVIGSNDENDLFICVSKIEIDFKTMQEVLVPLGLTNALILDGGGSSQLMVDGDLVKESDDRRPLPEFILIN